MTLIVKFSPSVCVAVVASLTGEVAVLSFAYHAHGTNLAVIHGYDKTAMHARSASSPDDNHLTSYTVMNIISLMSYIIV